MFCNMRNERIRIRYLTLNRAQFKIQEQRQVFSPFLVIITANHLHRSDLFQPVQDALTADISGMKNIVAPLKCVDHLRPKKIMGIR